MNQQKYCISLDLAKRLKELGVKQESYFWWHWLDRQKPTIRMWTDDFLCSPRHGYVSAYTSGELGEMLPMDTATRKVAQNMDSYCWAIDYEARTFTGDTEAEARGLMLEYLINNKLHNV